MASQWKLQLEIQRFHLDKERRRTKKLIRQQQARSQTCSLSYDDQSAQDSDVHLNLVTNFEGQPKDKNTAGQGMITIVILTSAERMKLTPIFNLSSKNAAIQPFESTLPLKRACNEV